MIKYYVDILLNDDFPEPSAGYDLAYTVNRYLELGIEEGEE